MMFSIKIKILLIILFMSVLLSCSFLYVCNEEINKIRNKNIDQVVAAHCDSINKIIQKKIESIKELMGSISQSPMLQAVVEDGDTNTVTDTTRGIKSRLSVQIFDVLDVDNELLASLDGGLIEDEVEKLALFMEKITSNGKTDIRLTVRKDQKLALIIGAPIGDKEDPVGVLIFGFYFDDIFAKEIFEISKTNVSFLSNGKFIGSSLKSKKGLFEISEAMKNKSKVNLRLEWGNDYLFVPKLDFKNWHKKLSIVGQISTLQYHQLSTNMLRSIIYATIITLVLGGLISIFLIKRMTDPLTKVDSMLFGISSGEGDLTQRLPKSSNDEVGRISMNFNQFVETIQKIIISVKNDTSGLNDVSQDLSKTSVKLIDQSNIMEEKTILMANRSETISENSASILEFADKSSEDVSELNLIVCNMSESLLNIADDMEHVTKVAEFANEQAAETTESLEILAKVSTNIDTVLNAIKSISEKTKLLSLNANIEATRAGEAGRGFKVVADEVKNLAKQTEESAAEIGKMISAIKDQSHLTLKRFNPLNKGVSDVLNCLVDSAKDIKKNAELSKDMSEYASSVESLVRQISSKMGSSSDELKEISEGINEVLHLITETNKSGKSVDECVDVVEEKAISLKALIDRFKV
ncbi:MAG: hypothetical protein COA79_01785 [Planctomycetota bacterium]|nr:MAG: hypothetical protein COA79_01785 [Planctomycetota bacterium]